MKSLFMCITLFCYTCSNFGLVTMSCSLWAEFCLCVLFEQSFCLCVLFEESFCLCVMFEQSFCLCVLFEQSFCLCILFEQSSVFVFCMTTNMPPLKTLLCALFVFPCPSNDARHFFPWAIDFSVKYMTSLEINTDSNTRVNILCKNVTSKLAFCPYFKNNLQFFHYHY
jgi:hypothetical protein